MSGISITFSTGAAALELWRFGEDDLANQVLAVPESQLAEIWRSAGRLNDPRVAVPVEGVRVSNGHVICFACIEVLEGQIRPLARKRRRPVKDVPESITAAAAEPGPNTSHDHPIGDLDAMSDIELRMAALVARDQDQVRCPFPLFDDIRREQPVYFSPALGAWVVTTYDDCLSVLHDPVRWSTRMHTGPKPLNAVLGDRMAELAADPETAELVAESTIVINRGPVLASADPPVHVRQRKLVNGAFRPGRLRALEPLVQEVSNRLLDRFADRGSVAFVEEFAVGLPMTIIAYALGVEDDDLATFKRWSDDMVMPVGNQHPSLDQVRGYLETHRDFSAYFTAKIAERQANPADDVVSDVANAEIDGDRLELREQLSIISQLLTAGNETTTKLITAMALYLAEDPELQDRLRTDRAAVPLFVEEVLRLEAPVGGLFRMATTDIVVGGTAIPKGDHVWVLYSAANRDERQFGCPAELDIDRPDLNDHIAFGHGQHFCLGAGLARLEAVVGLNAVLDRLDNIALAANNDFLYEDSYLLRGLRELHLTFTTHH